MQLVIQKQFLKLKNLAKARRQEKRPQERIRRNNIIDERFDEKDIHST
ncbi:hypothetical protein H8S33_14295 [Ornithinibacillus sp. BX22]|uniref:Uncharacterized protein n=1 Tax=Ornithinibacillus hominis TaxID=2763055 RepID=A0A923L7M0_9BACI|nr:hypothetical protein [Ornithinibacillus hominis]MBC5637963.1 hypothetical protein [Ornithinibacillus hominis]